MKKILGLLFIGFVSATISSCGGGGTDLATDDGATYFEKDSSELMQCPKCEDFDAPEISEIHGNPDSVIIKNEGKLVKVCQRNGYIHKLFTYKVSIRQDTGQNEDGSTYSYETVGRIPDGGYLEYHKNGNLKERGTLAMGQKIGQWTYYHTNGNKRREGSWESNWRKIGDWNHYDKDGLWFKKESF